jgi:hypothetical protein
MDRPWYAPAGRQDLSSVGHSTHPTGPRQQRRGADDDTANGVEPQANADDGRTDRQGTKYTKGTMGRTKHTTRRAATVPSPASLGDLGVPKVKVVDASVSACVSVDPR